MERFSSLVTKSRPRPVIGRTIFFTSDKNRPTRDEIYFIDFWRENLSMYRIIIFSSTLESGFKTVPIRCRIRRMRVDGSRIRKEKVADSKISRYVWTKP